MISRKIKSIHPFAKLVVVSSATGLMAMLLAGCGGKEEKAKPAPVTYQAPLAPPPPPVLPITTLQNQLGTDERIVWQEDDAPFNTEERKAILLFVNAFAQGDVDALRSQLTLVDQLELDQLTKNDQWNGLGDELRMIELQSGISPTNGQKCLLVVYQVGYVFQPQMWYYDTSGEGFVFESVWTPPDMMNKLSGGWGKWIESWHDIIQEELEISEEPDVELVSLEEYLDEGSTSDANGGGGGGKGGGSPGKGGGPSRDNNGPSFAPNG